MRNKKKTKTNRLSPYYVPSLREIRDLKIQDGREDDGALKDGKDWA